MKKLFDPEEYDKQVIQDHIRFLRAKKQVEDFKKQQLRTLEHFSDINGSDSKLLFNHDPRYFRSGFSALFQNQAIPEQDKEYIVEQIIKRDQGDNHLTKRKRDEFEDPPSFKADASQMDIDEEDQQLYNEDNNVNTEDKRINEFTPNKRRKLLNESSDVNTSISVNNNNIMDSQNNATINEHSDVDTSQKKRKATEMEIENEVEVKRRRID